MEYYAGVSQEELTGFRMPGNDETVAIEKYVIREMNTEKRAKYVGVVCTGGFGLLLSMGFVGGIDPNKIGEYVVIIAIIVVCFIFAIWGIIGIKKSKLLMGNVRNQKYEVMDCKAYEAKPEIGNTGEGLVRIISATNEPCKDNFYVDFESARLAKYEKETPFILFKSIINVYGKEVQYYILLSNKMSERAMERR